MDASKPVKVPACRSLWSQVLLSGIHNFLSRLIVSVLLQSFSTSECAIHKCLGDWLTLFAYIGAVYQRIAWKITKSCPCSFLHGLNYLVILISYLNLLCYSITWEIYIKLTIFSFFPHEEIL